jgi:predicted DNA-binding transcriptional regulator AlpA
MARREITGRKPGIIADLIKPREGDEEADGDEKDRKQQGHRHLAVMTAVAVARSGENQRRQAAADNDVDPQESADRRKIDLIESDAEGDGGRNSRRVRAPPTPCLALSIRQFCQAHSISEDFFYKLKRQGEAPRLMKVGARTLISMEAAAEWRRDREAATTMLVMDQDHATPKSNYQIEDPAETA